MVKRKLCIGMLAVMLICSTAVTADLPTAGQNTTQVQKYLVMDEGASVPNAKFGLTITGSGNAVDGTGTNGTYRIFDGIGTPAVKWDSGGTDGAEFAPGDTTITTAEHAAGNKSDLGYELEVGEKYARHTAILDFSGITFPEPGVYRYRIEETGTRASVTNDPNPVRFLDVYVADEGEGPTISGYVLHTEAIPESTNDVKSSGYVNQYVSHDITIGIQTAGNQAVQTRYFKLHAKIEGSVPGDVFDVSLEDDGNPNTTDGNADLHVRKNSVASLLSTQIDPDTIENPTSLTVQADGTVETDFYLKHGQTVVLRGVGDGVKYTISENPADYTPSATANEGTVSSKGDEVVVTTAAKDNIILFTNSKSGVVPTGILASFGPFIAVLVLAILGIYIFRKREQDNK